MVTADEPQSPTTGPGTTWAELTGPDGYLPVLILLLLATLATLLVGDSPVGAVVAVSLGAAALLACIFRSSPRLHLRRAGIAGAAVLIGLALASPTLSSHGRAEAGWVVVGTGVVVTAGALPLVLHRALQHRRVTINTLCATLSAYLLIGMLFSGIYRLHDLLATPFFAPSSGLPADGPPSAGMFSYFSFVTLTTVGYGDLTPGSDPARAWVILEAVTGQVFVITALARVVSLLGEERRRPPPAGSEPAAGGPVRSGPGA